jgi:uncharacterized protein involved in outer membrane biogenesis
LQVTLLGLGIAIILALVAALVGPHFVDWSQYRSVFEAQATRLVGTPVRVNGAIDVRILPTPSLVLRDIEASEPGIKAGEIAFELALGPLMRGEWRATDVRVARPQFTLALDRSGRIAWPGAALTIDQDALSIERFALEDGRATLRDESSGSSLILDRVWFNGDLRSLVGPLKGEGGFFSDGERFGYRLATGRWSDDAIKVRLNIDPSDRLVAVEADGMLRFERNSPRFEGALSIARPAGVVLARGRALASEAWRVTSRVKATPTGALIDQVEAQYGSDERALKLTGTGQIKFGTGARLEGVMSARQIDLDRTFVLPEGVRRVPLAVLRRFAEAFSGVLAPPIPVRLGLGIDTITLAGATLQSVRGDVATDGDAWNLETVEFRAPGMTQVRASGRMALVGDGATFSGPAVVESSDPKVLLAWLEGRPEPAQGLPGALRVSGDFTLGTQRIAVERFKAEVDRKAISGRLAYGWATPTQPARLDGELKAAELDIDSAIAFSKAALAGTSLDAPGEVALALDIGVATIGGVEAKAAKAKLSFNAHGLVFERVAVADLGGAALDLNGRIDAITTSPRGALTLDVDASRLDGVAAVLTRYLPQSADIVATVMPRLTPAKLSALLTVERADTGAGSRAELVVTGKAGATRLNIKGDATGDVGNIAAAEVNLNGRLYGEDGAALIALIGLDRLVATEKRPASLTVTASGRPADLQLEGRIAATKLEAAVKGSLRLVSEAGISGDLDVRLAAADAVALRRLAPDHSVPVTIRTRAVVKSGAVAFENISGVIAGTGVRGRLGVDFSRPLRLDGRLDADALDLAAIVNAAAGMPATGAGAAARWPTEPFAAGAFAELAGQVAFTAQRATLAPSVAAQDVRGLIRLGDGEVGLEDLEAGLGGGRLLAQLLLRAGADGLAVRGRVALNDVDAGAVLPGDARPVLNGRLALQLEADGSGLSPAALIGSLRGAGTVTLESTQIAGLDPRAFDAVIRAVDRGLTVDASKIRDMMESALQGGALKVARVDGAFSVSAGQARWGNVATRGEGADLVVSGALDLSEWTMDARLTLSGPASPPSASAGRPDVFISLKGPLAAPKRSLDVSAFAGWLTLRSIERQAKRLEALESERQDAAVGRGPPATASIPPPESDARAPSPGKPDEANEPAARPPAAAKPAPSPRRSLAPPEAAPPLPPPIDIRPVPGASGPGTSSPGASPREPRSNPSTIQRSSETLAPSGTAKPRTNDAPRPDLPPAAARRSLLDQLFGSQR